MHPVASRTSTAQAELSGQTSYAKAGTEGWLCGLLSVSPGPWCCGARPGLDRAKLGPTWVKTEDLRGYRGGAARPRGAHPRGTQCVMHNNQTERRYL